MIFMGELAALATAVCWAVTSILFDRAGRLMGSFMVNKLRLTMAAVIYVIVLSVFTGHLLAEQTTFSHICWLGLSGLVGLIIGDGAGLKAIVMIGPRRANLVFSAVPVMTTIIAWLFLAEALSIYSILGIIITISGIAWVISERQSLSENIDTLVGHPDHGSLSRGVILGLIAALGQAAGLVIAKYGMLDLGATVEPMQAAFIRITTATAVIWSLSAFRSGSSHPVAASDKRKGLLFCFAGALVGPFLGIWLSLVAVKNVEAGIAATLSSTTPVVVIPLVAVLYKEKVSFRAFLGAAVTVAGVMLLMLS